MFSEAIDETDADFQTFRHKQAQAMLDLFEKDRGQAAVALEEVKEWAYAQDNEHLQSRVDQFLSQSESSSCIS
jgi:hypothetical protein